MKMTNTKLSKINIFFSLRLLYGKGYLPSPLAKRLKALRVLANHCLKALRFLIFLIFSDM